MLCSWSCKLVIYFPCLGFICIMKLTGLWLCCMKNSADLRKAVEACNLRKCKIHHSIWYQHSSGVQFLRNWAKIKWEVLFPELLVAVIDSSCYLGEKWQRETLHSCISWSCHLCWCVLSVTARCTSARLGLAFISSERDVKSPDLQTVGVSCFCNFLKNRVSFLLATFNLWLPLLCVASRYNRAVCFTGHSFSLIVQEDHVKFPGSVSMIWTFLVDSV